MAIPEKLSTNKIYSGQHWAAMKEHKDLYHSCLLPFRKHIVKKYPVDITYIFRFAGKKLDTTNCTYMVKMLEDGMIHNKILENDSPEFVESTTIIVHDGDRDEVEIIIAEPQ